MPTGSGRVCACGMHCINIARTSAYFVALLVGGCYALPCTRMARLSAQLRARCDPNFMLPLNRPCPCPTSSTTSPAPQKPYPYPLQFKVREVLSLLPGQKVR